MNLASNILGSTAVTKIQETQGSPVLEVGSDKLTRGQLAHVECFNFHAARLLTHVLNKVLKVPNLKTVYEEIPPAMLAVPRMGVVSLAVLGAAFEAKGIGGQAPLENYYRKHMNGDRKVVTFDTLKHREHEEAARERKDRRRRKDARRNEAHRLRVGRFESRQPAAQFAKE